ncbi:MAG: twin-arginine translocation signal domain-containing protein, partial [Bacteroidales bacterium]|nr:twin-arginine translocation signal domain-containing protein [Bacteroidales bacterium]
MKRREFIKGSAVIALAAGTGQSLKAASMLDGGPLQALQEAEAAGPLIVSAPMLQNYAEESMGVAFAVSDLANGYVIVGRKPDLSDGRKVLCGGFRVTDLDDRIVRVRITGLKPA